MFFRALLCLGLAILSFSGELRAQAGGKVIANEDDLTIALTSSSSEAQAEVLLNSHPKLITAALVGRITVQASELFERHELSRALLLYRIVKASASKIQDRDHLALALHRIGKIYYWQGQYPESIPSLLEAARISADALLKEQLIQVQSDLAMVYREEGEYQKASDYVNRSLSLATEAGDEKGMAVGEYVLATVKIKLGNYDEALVSLQKSLPTFSKYHDNGYLSAALISLANISGVRGNHLQALKYLNQARNFAGNDLSTREVITAEMGDLSGDQGDYQNMRLYFEEALRIATELNEQDSIANYLYAIGIADESLSDYAQALDYFEKSYNAARRVDSRWLMIIAQSEAGHIHQLRGHYSTALNLYTENLKQAEQIDDKPHEALILDRLADLYRTLKQYPPAIESARKALAIAQSIDHKEMSHLALTSLGSAYRAQKEYEKAYQVLSQAISQIETGRGEIAGDETQQQKSFEDQIAPYYEMISLLAEQNKPIAAFNFAERAKGRALLDVLRSDHADVNKALMPEEKKQEETLNREVSELNTRIYQENLKDHPAEKLLASLDEQLKQARHHLEDFDTLLYTAHPELQLRRGDLPQLSNDEINALIPGDDFAILEYAVSDEGVYLFVITRSPSPGNTKDQIDLRIYRLPISGKELKKRVDSFRESIEARSYTYSKAANQLYDWLIAPAAAQLKGKKTLCIIPDGTLWELPFAALQHQSRFLIEDCAIFSVQSVSVLQQMKRRSEANARYRASTNARSLLVFANPSLGLEAIERAQEMTRGKLPVPLPGAEAEARTEANIYGVDQTTVYSAKEALEERFKTEGGDYRIIEFITHALIDDTSSMYSQILLAQGGTNSQEDGFLEPHEIRRLNLHADLVILSACETGLGHIGAGEGVIGLTWSFFLAGCPSTLATLWSVDSDSTSQMMIEFHRHFAGMDNSSGRVPVKATALRQAATKLMSEQKYRNPYYWAGFSLMGNPY